MPAPAPVRAAVAAAALALAAAAPSPAQPADAPRLVPVGLGWARSSVNAAIFRASSVVSHGGRQVTAWHDPDGRIVVAGRTLPDGAWELRPTAHVTDVTDAHNAISIAVDGRGVLHLAWGEHGRPLRYARGTAPGSLALGPLEPTAGRREGSVTYPQFVPLPGGDLLLLYRDGASGRGDVLVNRWDARAGAWRALHHPLLDGEGARNAYVNGLAVDARGGWHLSWCWRETPDVATNHDVLYAHSPDEGRTWRRSDGRPYALPITAATAEVAWPVPQGRELINQTSVAADADGRPLIATYWRPEGSDVPQYHLVWHDGARWAAAPVGARTQPFRLSGGGTKRIPISRPLVLAGRDGAVHVVFRDAERGGGIAVATARDAARAAWAVRDLHAPSVGQWEPTHDPAAWRERGALHLFVQRVGQGDGETLEAVPPQPVSILEWTPPAAPAPPASQPAALDSLARRALALAAERYLAAARALDPAGGFPRSTRPDGRWRTVPLHDWTSGFFPGTLWYLHEHTRDPALRAQAERWTRPLAAITRGTFDHDLGFQYGSSFGHALRLTGDTSLRAPLLDAAGHLAARHDPRAGMIRSWSWGEWRYPVIIDNLMNLELLFRAARLEGGDPAWAAVARGHLARTLAEHVRPDGGTFHLVDLDPATGAVVRRMTRQGHADSTTWARGQAWGIYGFTMGFRETGDARFLDGARRLAAYALARLPADHVPCWDYQAPGCPDRAPRDASAAAIMASALLELSTHVPGADGARYRAAAEAMLASLASPAYLAADGSHAAILRHSVGDLPRDGEVDVGIGYADYYFVEALLRYLELRGLGDTGALPARAR